MNASEEVCPCGWCNPTKLELDDLLREMYLTVGGDVCEFHHYAERIRALFHRATTKPGTNLPRE